MRCFFVTLTAVLFSISLMAKTTNVRSLDISGRFNACSVVDVDSSIGRVACWGQNHFPLFLDGFSQKSFVPVLLPEFTSEVTQVTAGYEHICVLLTTGSVQCWGSNQYGQLGLGHVAPAYSPIEVRLPAFATQIFSGTYNTCALLTTGDLYCWGDNYRGKLGLGNSNTVLRATLIPVSNVSSVSISSGHICLLQSGNILCAGDNSSLQLGVSGISQSSTFIHNGVSNATQLDVSRVHSCAVINTGEVKCWGTGSNGQLGNGANPTSSIPVVVVGLNNATEVASTALSTCARLTTGEVTCWGSNTQLVLGSIGPNTNTPRLVSGTDVVSHIEAGEVEICALLVSGGITCWGRGTQGLLGDGGTSVPRMNSLVDFTFTQTYRSFQAIALGFDLMFGLFPDGIVRATGNNTNRQLGFGATGAFGQNASVSYFVDSGAIAPAALVQVGGGHACSTKINGGIECWGRNYAGQTGDPTMVDPTYTPFQVYPSGVVLKLQTMTDANCALLNNGTVECWGRNNRGQLGDGGVLVSTAVPQAVPGMSGIVDLNCAKFSSFCCATKSTAEKLCWGYNNAGQLGHEPTTIFESSPVTVNWGSDAASITMGLFHTCYIDSQGKVFCFGGNFYGNLGDGTFVNSTSPRPVHLPGPALEVRAGATHTCALLQDSRLFCWGDNYYSTIGIGSEAAQVLKPVQVMEDVIHFDLGNVFSCALDSSKLLWCWGNNTKGNFGNGNNSIFPFPVPVNYKKMSNI